MYKVLFSKQADKAKKSLKEAGLEQKARQLLDLLMQSPFQNPPPFEKLNGNLQGYYSRRINVQHRLVYSVDKNAKIVVVHSMWSHYDF